MSVTYVHCAWCGARLRPVKCGGGQALARNRRYCAQPARCRQRHKLHCQQEELDCLGYSERGIGGPSPPDIAERIARLSERAARGLPLFGGRS